MFQHAPATSVFLVEVCHLGNDGEGETVGWGLWGNEVHAQLGIWRDKTFPAGEVGCRAGVRPVCWTTDARQDYQTVPQPTYASWSCNVTW